jgi:hypothetical protein
MTRSRQFLHRQYRPVYSHLLWSYLAILSPLTNVLCGMEKLNVFNRALYRLRK